MVLFTYKLFLCIYQEHDKQSGEESRVCHRCYAKWNDFLSDVDVEQKKVEKRRKAIETAEEVEEYNRRNPVMHIVDASPMMVDITIMLLSWYQLYRREFPAKDEEDIKDLGTLGTCLHILHIIIFLHLSHILHICQNTQCFVFRVLRRCVELFLNKNKQGLFLIEREKMHSIQLRQMTLSDGQILRI